MVREVEQKEYQTVYNLIRQDSARNYFIRLGLDSSKPVFKNIFGDWDDIGRLRAVLFQRLSGNLQFYAAEDFDAEGFAACISKLEFESLISPRSYSDKLLGKGLFQSFEDIAYISRLDKNKQIEFESYAEVEPLEVKDLDEVIRLYGNIFSSFSSKAVMEKRLISGRGRGVCIKHLSAMASVVQSEYEEKHSALIVGVGTAPEFQGQGLATKCLKVLCRQLLQEGKDLYLQFDNMDAGRIYQKLGFEPIDQVRSYQR